MTKNEAITVARNRGTALQAVCRAWLRSLPEGPAREALLKWLNVELADHGIGSWFTRLPRREGDLP